MRRVPARRTRTTRPRLAAPARRRRGASSPATARCRSRFAAMFAVYASEPNPTEPLKSLTVGERPEPEVGDGWVSVEVAAASLNMHDLWTLRGVGIKLDQFPMILGCDGAGRLADGSGVVLYPVIGDPGVAGDETLDPKRSLLTERYQGTFADTVVVPARNAVPKPAGL